MGIVVISKGGKLRGEDFEKAKEDFKTYIKITIDIESETIILGGEYHADAERLLLDLGSRQEDIWGGGVNLKTRGFEANAIINLRRGNDSTEILDNKGRKKFLELGKRVLKEYVKTRKTS